MAYEQGYSTILGLTQAEDPALRALGEGGRGRFSVELGSNLWSERVSSGPLAVAHPARPASPLPPHKPTAAHGLQFRDERSASPALPKLKAIIVRGRERKIRS